MNLTEKDRVFLATLKELVDAEVVRVEFREDGLKRLRLRQNYGAYVEGRFGMSRQGIRWRFKRLLNDIYPHAYETILWVESTFGTWLRDPAMAISRQRTELRRRVMDSHGRKVGVKEDGLSQN